MAMRLWQLLAAIIGCFHVVFARGPPIQSEPIVKQQIGRAGATLRLPCPVDSNPDPIITWSKDNENINAGWERFKHARDSLRIKDLHEEDSGRYVCTAVNGFGSLSLVYYVWVHPDVNETLTPPPDFGRDPEITDNTGSRRGDPPRWARPDQMTKRSHLLPAGATVRLKCRAEGRPNPDLTWYKDGVQLPDTQAMYGGDRDDDQQWTLKLTNIQESDAGRYTCKVFNRAGAINFTYTVDVIDRMSKPVILDPHPTNISVMYGQRAAFQCNVHSQVEPTVEWLKRVDFISDIRNKNSTITMDGQQFVVLKTGKVLTREDGTTHVNKLTIYSATAADAGLYICLAANSMGYNIRSAHLTVLPDPSREPRDPGSLYSGGLLSSHSLPIIIAISAVVVVVVVIGIVCLLRRRGGGGGSANSSTSSKASVLRHSPGSSASTAAGLRAPRAPTPSGDLKYEHPAAAAYPHPQLQPFLQHHQQQQQQQQQQQPLLYQPQHQHQNVYNMAREMKNYPAGAVDMHSDISMPPKPASASQQQQYMSQPPLQPYYSVVGHPQHTHIHYSMT